MTNKNSFSDLPDSTKDKKRLQQDKATIDLPDVQDIQGQENIKVPNMREMSDTTISSADEEGISVWNDAEPDQGQANEQFGPVKESDRNDLRTEHSVNRLEAKPGREEIREDGNSDELDVTDDSVDPEADVRPDEKEALERTENMDTPDNENLYRAELDDTDFEGEKLNEDVEVSGKDLDIPGAELDDENEEIGEEDEENNAYSLGDNE